MDTKNESRRDFLTNTSRLVIAAGIATVVGAGTKFSSAGAADKNDVVLGKVSMMLSIDTNDPANSALKANGGAIFIENPSDKDRPIIVYRKSDNEVTAISSKCTHKGGPVGLPGSDALFVCASHQAAFDTDGVVKKGPAKENLATFKATISDGTILVTI